MPEDDFDIYGEDEGFSVKPDEVRHTVFDARGHVGSQVRSRLGMMNL